MSDKPTKTNKWLDKLKNVKHIEIYIAVIFIVVLLLIYLSNTKSPSSKAKNSQTNSSLTVNEYVSNLENDLEEILSNIEGVTKVKVMISLDMSKAEIVDSKINLNVFPNIKGIVITAAGANSTTIKMKMLHAVEALVDVNNDNIEILSSK